jgi:uncharacterized membrane protein affecting hemolysin expression
MNDLTDHQLQTLARGLAEFEHAHRRRRRRSVGAVASLAVAAAAAVAAAMLMVRAPDRHALPAYVEIIADDRVLTEELALASACERVERSAGRLVVLECTAPGPR